MAAWSQHAQLKDYHPTDAQWEKLQGEWLRDTFPGRFQSYREYDSARSVVQRLTQLNLWSTFNTYCENHIVFSTP
eukprot:10169392-Alexandrium_andersonii.AAC.1